MSVSVSSSPSSSPPPPPPPPPPPSPPLSSLPWPGERCVLDGGPPGQPVLRPAPPLPHLALQRRLLLPRALLHLPDRQRQARPVGPEPARRRPPPADGVRQDLPADRHYLAAVLPGRGAGQRRAVAGPRRAERGPGRLPPPLLRRQAAGVGHAEGEGGRVEGEGEAGREGRACWDFVHDFQREHHDQLRCRGCVCHLWLGWQKPVEE